VSLAYLGGLTIGAALPGGASAAAAGELGINGALPDIQARITALAAFSPSLGNFTADLATAGQIIASINAALTGGITPPSLAAQLAAVAALVAELQAAALDVNAQLQIVLGFRALLATAGMHGYVYQGATNALGGALTDELATGFPGGGATAPAKVIVLGTTSDATWAAMSQVFKVAP
jgi:hypothetical protein